MSYRPSYSKGDWIALCDSCGRKFKASQLKKRWDGLMVCDDDFEIRHPQDFVRGVADVQAPPWTRPEATDIFIQVAQTTSIAAYAIAGAAIAGMTDVTGPGPVPQSSFNISGTP